MRNRKNPLITDEHDVRERCGEAAASNADGEAAASNADAPKGLHLVVKSHTICRGPDGVIKWEADTVPIHLPIGVSPSFINEQIVCMTIDTDQIKE